MEVCAACELYYVSPAPSDTELGAFYTHYADRHRRRAPTRAELDGLDLSRDVRLQELRSACELRSAEVLDVGCGHGAFLHTLSRLGARVQGVDLDSEAVAHARNEFGVDVLLGRIEDLPEQNFDVIILNDVLEHPLDPAGLFTSCTTRLADGGHIAIWTPNGDSRFPGRVQFRVDLEHMQYFTVRSIAALAARNALDIVHLETLGVPAIGAFEPTPRTVGAIASRIRRGLVSRARRTVQCLRPTELSWGSPERDGDYSLFTILRKPKR